MKKGLVVMYFCLSLPLGALAEEMVLQGTSIKAMEGLPMITFVVPWQTIQPAGYIAMPEHSVLDDALNLVDSTLLPVLNSNKAGVLPEVDGNN